jgi:hypothetical protein
MARTSYLLNSTLIWVFIFGWAGLVVWVIATEAPPPMGFLLGIIAWPFFMLVLATPGIVAYVGWERRRDEELQRRRRTDATVKLPIRREQLRPAKENGSSFNSEVVVRPKRSQAPSRPSVDEASLRGPGPASISSGPVLAREREGGNTFLDDFEKAVRLIMRQDQNGPREARIHPPDSGSSEDVQSNDQVQSALIE